MKRGIQRSAIGYQLTAAALGLVLLCVPRAACGATESKASDAELLRTAKALFFDGKYAEARKAWREVMARSTGAQAAAAAYWIARSSESLGQRERAFREYGEFLARKPGDRTLAEEARTSRASLAVRLVKDGKEAYRPALLEALEDPSPSVRYLAAIQAPGVGECGRAGPILRRMLTEEADEDLVQRARLALLRCDPAALQGGPGPAAPAAATRWLRVRIYERAGARPKLSLNIPVALADVVFKSLPEDARAELNRKGYDADNFWERLRRMPPAQILEIEGDEGERIQIWIE